MLEIFTTDKYDLNTAVIKGDVAYTYKDLKDKIAALIPHLKSKKDNIVIYNRNNYDFIIQFFASIYSGKTIWLLADKSKLGDLDIDYDTIDSIEYPDGEPFNFPNINPNDVLINFFTSGSSGKPKPIAKSLFNLISEGDDIGKTFGFLDKNLTVMSTTTMCHLFGMTFHLMTSLCNRLVINTDTVSYPENIDRENVFLVSTPTFLASALKHDLKFKVSPKYIVSAGSKLDNEIFRELEKDSNVIEIYGSTETGVIANRTHYNDSFTLFENVKVIPNEKSVEVHSDYAFGGKATINDNVEIHNRKLKVKNRTDRVLKICEKRISADELETKLKKHEFVENCYITQSDDKLACLCVLSESGKNYLLDKNIASLIKTLKQASIKISEIIPQKWKFLDAIPMNDMGKIDKGVINHLFNMKLSLPIILEKKADISSVTYKIFFHNRCNFFKGHFNEFPLVPGVFQIYFAKELANYHYKLDIGQGQWKRIKFSNIIKPDSVIYLRLEKTEKNVNFEYYSDDIKYASGTFLCENIFNELRESKHEFTSV